MNERIKELVSLSTTKEETYPAGCNGYPTIITSFSYEKFAELIIGKCLEFCEPMPDSGDIDDLALARVQTEIKEYFGANNANP